jgi:hypothetical protein
MAMVRNGSATGAHMSFVVEFRPCWRPAFVDKLTASVMIGRIGPIEIDAHVSEFFGAVDGERPGAFVRYPSLMLLAQQAPKVLTFGELYGPEPKVPFELGSVAAKTVVDEPDLLRLARPNRTALLRQRGGPRRGRV